MTVAFLTDAPKFLFFTGKGGTGKTSLACATALHYADQGRQVLLVSTDPASNVGHVFDCPIGHRITKIGGANGLAAIEIDPQQAASQYREKILAPVRGRLPASALRSIEEQLSGACTTEIAAFDEFTTLLTDEELVARYDHIVFDTAPTGHTIRLLQLPAAWDSYIEANPGGASCLGPLAGLEKQKQRYQNAVCVLTDGEQTRLVLVARAQTSSLAEVGRTSHELGAIGMQQQHLAINGLMPADEADDPLASALRRREQQALAALPEVLKRLPTDHFPLKAHNILGLKALRSLFSSTDSPLEHRPEELSTVSNDHDASLRNIVNELAEVGHGLIMLMGKGGVGKTTLATAIAMALTEQGHEVHLTTSDPAAHLDTSLANEWPSLHISRIDPAVETERYVQQVLATQGKDLDAAGKALLEEDLRSPCTEEIAVFQAFSRLIDEATQRFVVMDTAPTGHTLLLLDATGAYHREVNRLHGKSNNQPTPMMRLQNADLTRVLITTLAETTPVLEAARLQEDLRRAGIEPWGWLVNQALSVSASHSSLLQWRARQERELIEKIGKQYARRMALIPLQAEEPTGTHGLKQLYA